MIDSSPRRPISRLALARTFVALALLVGFAMARLSDGLPEDAWRILTNQHLVPGDAGYIRHLVRNNDIVLFESRYEALRPHLPKHGKVGYATDAPPAEVLAKDEHARDYYLTQYTLAPLVVANGLQHDVIIGNYDSAGSGQAAQLPGFDKVLEVGNGVVLFRRRPTP